MTSDEIRSLCHLSSKDGCGWTFLSSKPYPSVTPGFVAYLIKDNALKELCVKTLVYYINIAFPDWVIVLNIIPRNVIINRGAAVATGDIIKYQSFVYGSFVWGIHMRYNKCT